MTQTLEEQCTLLRERAEADGIRFFLAMFVNMHGKPCAKMVPAPSLDGLLESGAGFAGFAVGDMGQSPADPDLMAVPDPTSYMRLPWKPEVPVLHCDPHVEGEPWPYAPRVILRRLLEEAREQHGVVLKTGVEAEYILVRRTANGGIEVADPLDTSAKPCYEAKGLSRMWDHLARVSDYVNELGWGNYANDHEDACGQFEQNFTYDDALITADRTIFFRYMVHMLAHEAGMAATFMPKPFSHLTGNGLHTPPTRSATASAADRREEDRQPSTPRPTADATSSSDRSTPSSNGAHSRPGTTSSPSSTAVPRSYGR